MFKTIRGICDNGDIRPLEDVPISGRAEVVIVFLETPEARRARLLSVAGAWRDVDTDELMRVIYESRRSSTRREVVL